MSLPSKTKQNKKKACWMSGYRDTADRKPVCPGDVVKLVQSYSVTSDSYDIDGSCVATAIHVPVTTETALRIRN